MQKLRLKNENLSVSHILFVLLIVFSIIPSIGIKFVTAGFTWTAYRLVCALVVIYTVFEVKALYVEKGKFCSKWIVFLTIWVVYGTILLFVARYSVFHSGFIECLSLLNGLITLFFLSRQLSSEYNRYVAIRLIYWALNVMLFVGIIEILTGWHLSSSKFSDVASYGNVVNNHLATGFMYNENDFSAMLTCLTPVLIDRRLGKKRLFTIAGVMLVNLINDAATCVFAICAFAGYYLLVLRGGKSYKAIILKLFLGAIALCSIALFLFTGISFSNRNDMLGSVARTISGVHMASGSLYRRFSMYTDGIVAWRSTGMLGMGPGGFTNYFVKHGSVSGLTNPHAFLIEILTQYGIVILLWFVFLLSYMFRSANKKYHATSGDEQKQVLMVIAFTIIYFVISFAPSSFIGYSYPWMLIALMCSQLDYGLDFG